MINSYESKPWLRSYPDGIPSQIDIPAQTICRAFDEATEKWHNRTAIIFYGKKITFKELRDKVDRFATALFHLGVEKGDVIALLLLNSPEHIIAFYGAIKIGAITTPLSPVYVSPEIKHQLLDSGAKIIICHDILYQSVAQTDIKFDHVILTSINESLPMLKKWWGKKVLRDVYQRMAAPSSEIFKKNGFYRFQDLLKNYPPSCPRIEINPKDDILTLPYTGGTTGMPKGVMLTHYNLIAGKEIFHSFNPFLEDGKEVMIAYAPFYHIGGLGTVVVNGICRGYTLVVLTTPETDVILHSILRYKASLFHGAPAIYQLLSEYEKTDLVNWKKLKLIISGADTLHEITARKWKERTKTSLTDLYGMTEVEGVISCPRGKEKNNSIGIPMPNTLAAILDADKNEFIPVGEMGELAVSGPQLCKGYWKSPEETQECEAIINRVKWWRTGDLGKMDDDGYFYIYDRKRDLIKYKGLRVFAREVEEVLKTNPKVKDVGVIGVPDIHVGENIKAVVVLESDARGSISENDLIEYCRTKLAHYKVPRIIKFAGEIPKTDVGKVSRKELREEEV